MPTAPAAAVTSTREPKPMRTSSVSGIHAVRNAIGNAAPSAKLADAGRSKSQRGSTATRSAYPPPWERTKPMTRRPSISPAISEPSTVGQLGHLRVAAQANEDVREVDSRRPNVDDRLTLGGLGLRRPPGRRAVPARRFLRERRLALASGELRLALLEERGHALEPVLAREAAAEALRLAPQALLQREVACRACELAQDADRHG